MKKTWIIISSIIAILLLLAFAWWYLLMNGRPAALEAIPNPFGNADGTGFSQTETGEVTGVPAASFDASLRQVTVGQVAGAVFVEREGTTYIRYAERGTGHIYEYDTGNNTSERITNTTVPRTIEAHWSPFGTRVVLVSETSTGGVRLFAGAIVTNDNGETVLEGTELSSEARNIAFSEDGGGIYYTITNTNGSVGYEYDVQTEVVSTRFSSALRAIRVSWEPTLYVFTAPSASLTGYLYRGTTFAREAGYRRGLTTTPAQEGYALSYSDEGTYVSYNDATAAVPLSIAVFPEKCVADPLETRTLWCGAPLALPQANYPDAWYQGTLSLDDSIWKLDLATGGAMLVSVPSEDVNEEIDVIDMDITDEADMLLFTNKRDGSLWLQELD